MSPKESKYTITMIEIAGELHREGPKAYLFDDGTVAVWLPKSQCKWEPNLPLPARGNKPGVMHVPEWMAKDKGLI